MAALANRALLCGVTWWLMQTAAAAGPLPCTGDCGDDGNVTVDEIVAAVTLALAGGSTATCGNADGDRDGMVTVDEIVAAVNNALQGCSMQVTPTATAASATPTPTILMTPGGGVPTAGPELRPWLEAGNYLGWRAESGMHRSSGPHPVTVRTFINDALFDSLSAGNAQHPRGAAAVKEMYDSSGTVQGWAVSAKIAADSNGGVGWYWYEVVGSDVYADGVGEEVCTGCHVFSTRDFILIPFPLQ